MFKQEQAAVAGWNSRPRLARRIAVALALPVLLQIGQVVPLPGIAPDLLISQLKIDGGLLHLLDGSKMLLRVSIFALGLTPLFSILLLVEIAKLIFPSAGRFGGATTVGLKRWIAPCVFLDAAMQGYGVATAIAANGRLVDQPDIAFVATAAATLAGAAMLAMWFVDLMDRYGIAPGLWIFFGIADLAELRSSAVTMLELARQGSLSALQLSGFVASAIAAVALLVFARGAFTLSPGQKPTPVRRLFHAPRNIGYFEIWPLWVAQICTGWIYFAIVEVGRSSGVMKLTGSSIGLVRTAVFIVMLLLVQWTAKSRARVQEDIQRPGWPMIATQVVLCAGAGILNWLGFFPIWFYGPTLITTVVVLSHLRNLALPRND